MSGIRPFTAILAELRDGHVVVELSQAIHEAMAAVKEHGKAAKIHLTVEIKPLGTKGVSDALEFTAEVATKLPKADPPSTLFFADADGNPSRNQHRQRDLALSIAEKGTAA